MVGVQLQGCKDTLFREETRDEECLKVDLYEEAFKYKTMLI